MWLMLIQVKFRDQMLQLLYTEAIFALLSVPIVTKQSSSANFRSMKSYK